MSKASMRKCTSLQPDEQVVFNVHSDIFKRKIPMNGSVVFVDKNKRTVNVSWLEGYREHHNDISFDDMLAVHNPAASVVRFENISGKSDLLIPE